MSSRRILLIEDDPQISRSLALSLNLQGYVVSVCETYCAGLRSARSEICDLVLLDVNLPDGDGFSLCREIRLHDAELPILMLTANIAEESAVRGMQSGADDYIRKPYGLLELIARMERLLQKASRSLAVFGSLRIDYDRHQAWVGEIELALGKREFSILAMLVDRGGEVLARRQILEACGEDADVYDRTIDSHLSHLRKKMRSAGACEQILPVYGVGYKLVSA